jgi:excisionase family DNA binding protein
MNNTLPELLDIDEAAAVLRISKYTLYRWTSERKIVYVKLGSRLLFERAELHRFIESRRIPAE